MGNILGISALALLLSAAAAEAQVLRKGAVLSYGITAPAPGWNYLNGSGIYSSGGTYGNGIGSLGQPTGPKAPEANGG
ncbi:MAG: hypothetical protein WBX25_25425 [Rhodomicrobium sp.]